MREIPLTVLFHEGPMARAYLEMLRICGVRPSKIILMANPTLGLRRLASRGVRIRGAIARQERAANHWPRVLSGQYPGLTVEMTRAIETGFDLEEGFLEAIRSGCGMDRYCDNVEVAEVAGFRDPAFIEHLQAQPPSLLLFTGGGILPARVFEAPHIRFLHVHPGYLPNVRGADGLLWSTLVRGRPGASAFIMQPGLDLGDLVRALEVEPLRFAVPENETPDDLSLYRLLFSFLDPVIRAHVLRETLPLLESQDSLAGRPQDHTEGVTYHFMEPRTRHRALGAIFDFSGG